MSFSRAREADRRARRTEPGGGVFFCFDNWRRRHRARRRRSYGVNDAQRDKSDIFRENSDDASQGIKGDSTTGRESRSILRPGLARGHFFQPIRSASLTLCSVSAASQRNQVLVPTDFFDRSTQLHSCQVRVIHCVIKSSICSDDTVRLSSTPTRSRAPSGRESGEDIEREIPFLKGHTVFNVEQIDGLPDHYYAQPAPRL